MWLEVFCGLGIVITLIVKVLRSARENYGVLEAGNIPVIPTTMFMGSEPDLHLQVPFLEDIKRFKKYGGVWGSYVGTEPQVHLADPDLIRLVYVKEASSNFHNKPEADFGSEFFNEILDYLPGEKWKTVRDLLSPLFTTSKLKAMSNVIESSATEFVEELKEEAGRNGGRVKFDCSKRLSAYLVDMFGQTVMGIRMEGAKDPDNWFAQTFRDMMGESSTYNWFYTASMSYPMLAPFAPTFNAKAASKIEETFKGIMDNRRKSGSKPARESFLDLLVAQADKCKTDKNYKRLGITERTIIAQASNFFVGGYDTSTSVLTHLFEVLSRRPDIQQKMQEEVDSMVEKFDGNINYESTRDSEIPYTLGVIKEALRLFPAFIRPDRACTADWSSKEHGISIKKGTKIVIPAWAANRNPAVYESPDEFIPERWSPENKDKLNPYAFTTFGFGPRNCIGMRFAFEALKLLVCNFARQFSVERRSDTNISYKKGSIFMVVFDCPVYVDLVPRL